MSTFAGDGGLFVSDLLVIGLLVLLAVVLGFGLTVTFASPDRDRYLYIVGELAKQYGVDLDLDAVVRDARRPHSGPEL